MAKYCMYCGTANADAETICSKCGKALKSSFAEHVNMEQNVSVNYQYSNYSQSNYRQQRYSGEDIQKKAESVAKTYVDILRKPFDAGAAYIRNADILTIITFMGAQALVSAVFAVICALRINALDGGDHIIVPVLQAFILTIIYSGILYMISTALLFVLIKIGKGAIDFKAALAATSMKAVVLVPVILASCLLFKCNEGYGLILYIISYLIGIVYQNASIYSVSGVHKNKRVYIFLAMLLLSILIFVIFARIVCTSYVSDEIKGYIQSGLDKLNQLSRWIQDMVNK